MQKAKDQLLEAALLIFKGYHTHSCVAIDDVVDPAGESWNTFTDLRRNFAYDMQVTGMCGQLGAFRDDYFDYTQEQRQLARELALLLYAEALNDFK